MNINDVLTRYTKKIVPLNKSASIGMKSREYENICKSNRSSTNMATISSIALSLCRYAGKELRIGQCMDSAYAERYINGKLAYRVVGLASSGGYYISACTKFEDPRTHLDEDMAADAMFASAMKDCVDFRRAYEDTVMSVFSTESLFYLCDVFRYVWMEDLHHMTPETKVSIASITEEELQNAYDQGNIKSLPGRDTQFSFNGANKRAEVTEEQARPQGKSLLQSLRDGDYLLKHEWPEEAKPFIKPLSYLDTFVPGEKFSTLVRKFKSTCDEIEEMKKAGKGAEEILTKRNIAALLFGKPGTGKSSSIYAISAAFGIPVYVVSGNRYTESDTFEGMYKIREGSPAFAETPFLKCAQTGGILAFEEINLIDPNVLTSVGNQFLEYPYIVMRDGVETVRRDPYCFVIGTMNTETEGSVAMNEAFVSRFRQKYLIEDPPEKVISQVLQSAGYEKKRCDFVAKVYMKVLKQLRSNTSTAELVKNVTIRSCLGALEDMKDGSPAKEALTDAMANSVRIVDVAAGDTLDALIDALPDNV